MYVCSSIAQALSFSGIVLNVADIFFVASALKFPEIGACENFVRSNASCVFRVLSAVVFVGGDTEQGGIPPSLEWIGQPLSIYEHVIITITLNAVFMIASQSQ